ncbi:MAG: tetratricopeptide repeat protein [Kiritimatiellae bacterium]|nr:tetratricopeptide repeat protein [Kiritimatiellia bacterium]
MKRLRTVFMSFLVVMLVAFPGAGASAQRAGSDREKDRMQAEVARLQKAFDYFQSERDQLKADLDNEQTQNKVLKDRLARFTQALQKNKQAIEIYKNRLKNVSDTPNELQKKLDQTNLKIVQLESARNKLEDQLRELNNELTKEQRLRKTQEQMTQEKELAAHDAEVRAEAANRQIRLMEAEQKKLSAQIETLKKQAETDYTGYLNMEDRLADYETRMNAAAQQVQAGVEEIARLRDALTQADAEYAELKKTMQQNESELAARLRKADANINSMESLAQEKQQAERNVEILKKAFQEEQQLRRTLEQKARQLEQSLLTNTTGLDEAQRDVARLTRENEQLTEDLRVFEKALEEERARRQVQEDLAKRAKQLSGSVERSIESLQLQLQMAEQEKDIAEKKELEATNAMDALLRSQQIAQNNLNALQADHQQLLADYQNIQQDAAETERENKKALQNVDLLKKALSQERKVRAEKEKLVAQFQSLQQSVESNADELTGQVNALKAQLMEAQRESRMLKESLTASEQMAVRVTTPAETAGEVEAKEAIKRMQAQIEELQKSQKEERKKGYEAAQLDMSDDMNRLKEALKAAEQRVNEMELLVKEREEALKQEQLARKKQSATVDAGRNGTSKAVFGETAKEGAPVKKFTKETPVKEGEMIATKEAPKAVEKAAGVEEQAPAPAIEEATDNYADLEAVLAEVEPEPDPERARREKQMQHETTLMNSAFSLYSDGEVAEAKGKLNKLLSVNADHVDALGMAGVIAWQEGDMDGAVRYLEKALSLDERNARAHNYMGIVQNSLGQSARAEKEFKRSMELDTSYDEPLFNMAVILATSDELRIDEARRYYERSLALGSERNASLEDILYP